MSQFHLRLLEDLLPAGAAPVYLPALERALYVVEGELTVEHATGGFHQRAGGAWLGGEPLAYLPGEQGARVWRWELVGPDAWSDGRLKSAPGSESSLKLAAPLDLDPRQDWLMRCDQVSFPPGGIAYTHVHQGPGIRCCLIGEIQIDTEGRSGRYAPGEAWFESGYASVYAPTTEREATSFIRCFILPRACKGRSSIRYVDPADRNKPKLQAYQVLAERFVALPAGGPA